MCSLCPVDAKFTVLNEMSAVYDDPRVTVLTQAEVGRVETTAGIATGVTYRQDDVELLVKAEAVALGANAIFNAFILLKSGFDDPALGRYLHEQAGIEAFIDLDGMRGFQGSTVITGQGYMFYDGPHRSARAAAMLEGWNRTRPRLAHGRWAETTRMKMIFEDLPLAENHVAISPDNPDRPIAITERRSDYMRRSFEQADAMFGELFAHLPVEGYTLRETTDEGHIMGTARMGTDPATSVVDHGLVHHGVRNLWVLGGSSFVTGAPANPTLTLSALSLRAADQMFDHTAGDNG
jgi:choline dehydrogenase-like flavoprotein